MKPLVLLILMQHQKICITGTILKLTGEIECGFESSFTFYAKVENVLGNAAIGKSFYQRCQRNSRAFQG